MLVDYKTTGTSIEQWEKNYLWNGGYLQDVHYRRVYELATGKRPRDFIFVVQESFEPYLMQIIVIEECFSDEINRRYEIARDRFINCLNSDTWRGYPNKTAHSYPPPWVIKNWEALDMNEKLMKQEAERPQESDNQNLSMAG